MAGQQHHRALHHRTKQREYLFSSSLTLYSVCAKHPVTCTYPLYLSRARRTAPVHRIELLHPIKYYCVLLFTKYHTARAHAHTHIQDIYASSLRLQPSALSTARASPPPPPSTPARPLSTRSAYTKQPPACNATSSSPSSSSSSSSCSPSSASASTGRRRASVARAGAARRRLVGMMCRPFCRAERS